MAEISTHSPNRHQALAPDTDLDLELGVQARAPLSWDHYRHPQVPLSESPWTSDVPQVVEDTKGRLGIRVTPKSYSTIMLTLSRVSL